MTGTGETTTHSAEMTIEEALEFGAGYARKADHRSAVGIYRAVLQHEPENFTAMYRLGTSLLELGAHYEALFWFWRARKIDRKHPLVLMNYGLTLSQLGYPEEGLPFIERSAVIVEHDQDAPAQAKALAWNNLGNTLERLGKHKDALPVLDKGIARNPTDPFPHYNRGIVLLRLGRQAEAIEALKLSLTLTEPEDSTSRLNDADTHYNLGMAYLLLGDFANGWPSYEYRLLTSETNPANLGLNPAEKWQIGDSIEGKRVLVHCEQGLGDAIQFMRYLSELKKRGPAEILLITHRLLRHLVKIDGVRVLQPGTKLVSAATEYEQKLDAGVPFDCWVAQMSLPLYLGHDREDQIPAPWSFPAKPRGLEHLRNQQRLNVGVCWAGYFRHKNDAQRSIPLEQFSTLFGADANFISVQQVRPGEVDLMRKLVEYDHVTSCEFEDFGDTAAALALCDLVISVDTSVAHLAGSMGKPTWILVPKFSSDWRWQLERTDSPWYPSMKLYRQDRIGDWRPTLARVKADLEGLAAQRAAA